MIGTIVKSVAGDYSILSDNKLYVVKARGLFRNLNMKPICGDEVEFSYDKTNNHGNIIKIYDRKNSLIRPAVSNIDIALIIMSTVSPRFDSYLVDKLIVQIEMANIEPVICVSKCEYMQDDLKVLIDNYIAAGYQVICFSAHENINIDKIKEIMSHKKVVLCGQSAVGKSSLINSLIDKNYRSIGEYSKKLGRGKHQTREVEFIQINDSLVADTPGFSKLMLNIEETSLARIFKDFDKYAVGCKYNTCLHENEPDCKVIEAVNDGLIHPTRYQNYLQLLKEVRSEKKWKK